MQDTDTRDIVSVAGKGCSFTIDPTHAPEYVLVTGYGLFDLESFQEVRASIARVMDGIVGPGRRFCPIIFDMSCGRPNRKVSIPGLREAEGALMRRYDRVLLVYQHEDGTVFDFFVRLFAALAPQAEQVATLDEALVRLSER